MGRVLKKMDVERNIVRRCSNDCTFVPDKHRSISCFTKSEGLDHTCFKESKHSVGVERYVQNMNNLVS